MALGFPQSAGALPAPRQDSDGSVTETVTIPAAPGQYRLGTNPPLSYRTDLGIQIVPPQGVAPVVTASDNSAIFSRQAVGAALAANQYTLDDTTGPAGGQVTFAAADQGRTVSIRYVGAIAVNEAWFGVRDQAIRDIAAALNQANGIAGLDSNGHVLEEPASKGQQGGLATLGADGHLPAGQAPAVGVRSKRVVPLVTAIPNTNISAGWAAVPNIATQTFVCQAGSALVMRVTGQVYNSDAAAQGLAFRVVQDGANITPLSQQTAPPTSVSTVAGECVFPIGGALCVGSHTYQLQWECGGTGVSIGVNGGSVGPNPTLTFTLEEIVQA